jgi:DNA-directed RNA polymerase subunit RPC12/RpoP
MKDKDCSHQHFWEFDGKRRCLRCGKIIEDSKRHPIAEEIDVSKLVKQLGNKKRKDGENQPKKKPAPELLKCPNPQCGKLSLFWNESLLLYECLNPKCRIKASKAELEGTHPLQVQNQQEQEFTNPFLLTLKMFLAEVRSWRREYIEDEYVCSDFAKEVYEAATRRKIRCGYVKVHFEDQKTAHAILAFETDYGLKFIEPQSGEEESVRVGEPYPVIMQGIPSNAVVRMAEIRWNDGTITMIE